MAHMNMGDMRMEDMDMGDMRMGDAEIAPIPEPMPRAAAVEIQFESPGDPTSDAVVSSLPGDLCIHCLSHSQPMPGSISAIAIDPAKRSFETNVPVTGIVALLPPASLRPLNRLGHGPPRDSGPLRVLVGVFRI